MAPHMCGKQNCVVNTDWISRISLWTAWRQKQSNQKDTEFFSYLKYRYNYLMIFDISDNLLMGGFSNYSVFNPTLWNWSSTRIAFLSVFPDIMQICSIYEVILNLWKKKKIHQQKRHFPLPLNAFGMLITFEWNVA